MQNIWKNNLLHAYSNRSIPRASTLGKTEIHLFLSTFDMPCFVLSFCSTKQRAWCGVYSTGFSFSRPLALQTAHWEKMQLQRLASEHRITHDQEKQKSTGWPRILRNGRDKHCFSVLKYLTAEENLNFKVTWWWNHRFAKHATCMVWMTLAKFLFLLQNCMVFSQQAPGSFTVMYSSWRSYCNIHTLLSAKIEKAISSKQ